MIKKNELSHTCFIINLLRTRQVICIWIKSDNDTRLLAHWTIIGISRTPSVDAVYMETMKTLCNESILDFYLLQANATFVFVNSISDSVS